MVRKYLLVLLLPVVLLFFDVQTDYGDYGGQMGSWFKNGSLVDNGYLLNRYPPLTSMVYYALFSAFSFLNPKVAIMLIHGIFAIIMQMLFLNILKEDGYNQSKNNIKYIITSFIVWNPFVISLMMCGVNSELPFMIVSMAAFLFFLRYKRDRGYGPVILTGLCTGLAILTRLQGMALLVSLVLVIILYNRDFKKALVLAAVAAAVVAPWQVLNSQHSGGFLSTGGLPSFRDGLSFNHKPLREPVQLPEAVSELSDTFYQIYYIEKEQMGVEPETGEVAFVTHYLAQRPGAAIQLFLFKFSRCFYGTDSQNHRMEVALGVTVSLLMALLIWSFIVLWRTDKRKYGPLIVWFLIYSAGVVLMSVMVLSIFRYQVILWPMAFYAIMQSFKHRIIQSKLPKTRETHLTRRLNCMIA